MSLFQFSSVLRLAELVDGWGVAAETKRMGRTWPRGRGLCRLRPSDPWWQGVRGAYGAKAVEVRGLIMAGGGLPAGGDWEWWVEKATSY